MFVRSAGLVFLLSLMFAMQACKSTGDSSLDALEITNRESELCGIKKYKRLENKSCGTIYLKKSAPPCDVKSYHRRPNKKCPGYVPGDDKEVFNGDCPSGYKSRSVRQMYKDVKARRSSQGTNSGGGVGDILDFLGIAIAMNS